MTNNTTPPRGFNFSTATLVREASRLLGTLNDDHFGPPVVAHLPATFVADFQTQLTLVKQSDLDQSGATGNANALTHAQARAYADYVRIGFVARRAAALTFRNQDALLHSEFQVGVHTPR